MSVPARGRAQPVAGHRIGILCLDTCHELVVGNIQHARSFDFPVAYQVVRNVSLAALMSGDEAALPAILEGVESLQAMGVEMIVGACGSFGHYQKDIAEVARVPVCLSIMVEVPLILSMLPSDAKLGILFARSSALTPRLREQCAIGDEDRLVVLGADQLATFRPVLDPTLVMDSSALARDVVRMALAARARVPAIAAWLIQCSDLPPYSAAIADATGLPVFDMIGLIRHLALALEPRVYPGGRLQ